MDIGSQLPAVFQGETRNGLDPESTQIPWVLVSALLLKPRSLNSLAKSRLASESSIITSQRRSSCCCWEQGVSKNFWMIEVLLSCFDDLYTKEE